MLATIQSLIPIFLLIAVGYVVKRTEIIAGDQFRGIEKLTFFLFFPALLANTLYRADFSMIAASDSALAFITGIAIIMCVGYLARIPVQKLFGIGPASFSSVYQGFTRWNAFIALAVAETFSDPNAVTIVVIGIGVLVVPSNLINVLVVAKLGSANVTNRQIVRMVLANPLILGVLAGLALNVSGIALSKPLEVTLDLASRSGLPLGLVLVGTGLAFRMSMSSFSAALLSTLLKLVLVPLVYVTLAYWFGIRGNELIIVGLCGAAPTAMNGYLIAKELGGDAPLYAAIATLQTVAGIFTIPLVIEVTTYFSM